MFLNNSLKKILFSVSFLIIFILILFFSFVLSYLYQIPKTVDLSFDAKNFWEIQSIDTMKYSRDLAREMRDSEDFENVIKEQINNIALSGANYVAIATPYDEEFILFLEKWIEAAREADLKVWFRGNFSGWEGWFGYSPIGQEEHVLKTKNFILNHSDLFRDGDIFSSCPECENGSIGDPRDTGEFDNFRNFVIREYLETKKAFKLIDKKVDSNFLAMNGDVANLIMDKQTSKAFNNLVTIDHYVEDVDGLIIDLEKIIKQNDVEVFLGEIGVPIPDIHGSLSEEEQAEWLDNFLFSLSRLDKIFGFNYWTSVGGSTALWNENGEARLAVKVLEKYFKPNYVYGAVKDELGRSLDDVEIFYEDNKKVNSGYYYEMPKSWVPNLETIFKKKGYIQRSIFISNDNNERIDIVMEKEEKTYFDKILIFINNKLNKYKK